MTTRKPIHQRRWAVPIGKETDLSIRKERHARKAARVEERRSARATARMHRRNAASKRRHVEFIQAASAEITSGRERPPGGWPIEVYAQIHRAQDAAMRFLAARRAVDSGRVAGSFAGSGPLHEQFILDVERYRGGCKKWADWLVELQLDTSNLSPGDDGLCP